MARIRGEDEERVRGKVLTAERKNEGERESKGFSLFFKFSFLFYKRVEYSSEGRLFYRNVNFSSAIFAAFLFKRYSQRLFFYSYFNLIL